MQKTNQQFASWSARQPCHPSRDRVALHIELEAVDVAGVAESIVRAVNSPTANRDPSVIEKAPEEYRRSAASLREFAATLAD